jgi:hypothetical protein
MKHQILPLTLAFALIPALQPFQAENAWAQNTSAQPCQAQPDAGKGSPPQGGDADDKNRAADCNGVLHPPAVGDPELVKPAPEVGKTPVIPPGSVPKTENGQGQPQ